jgi:hypothetical protein
MASNSNKSHSADTTFTGSDALAFGAVQASYFAYLGPITDWDDLKEGAD